ncbi:hypothetical protein H072_2076 [Dactylellina haptotyla CBS 200.50]|uniref:Uncharacterized protein n=1 Tax=Dactylellina haptotyla (strain CBS 200.50) TaxID=1284197 RepID=S8C8D8_DACHA|nr:hypothetical protein H072_2076 [Dactylellina haptotyla CBS 200.50]
MPKRPHPPPTRRKKTPKTPETADEYLAAAVDLEESGERWRSGDVAKSGRFFLQAISAYEATLARYPDNFDARYNRARLLYTLTQLPLPPTFFPAQSTAESRLFAAVEAHKECNDLEKDSSDVLFNYGQILSSLGEFYSNKSYDTDEAETPAQEISRLSQAKEAFETAWGALSQCLTVQEAEYKSTQEQSQSFNGAPTSPLEDYDPADPKDGSVKLPRADSSGSFNSRRDSTTSSHSSSSGNNVQWAAIVEPTTKSTLLDTALAMLEVQTNILNLATPATSATLFSAEYADQLTSHARITVENYIIPIAGSLHQDSSVEPDEIAEREPEAILARANFLTALAEVQFYLGTITIDTWEAEVKTAFEEFTLYKDDSTGTVRSIDLTRQSWMALCDRSTAYTTLATTIGVVDPAKAWKLASLASQDLAAATKIVPDKGRAEVYLARGNLELLRSRVPVEAAEKAKGLLRKNAGVYYRGVAAAASGRAGFIGAAEGGKVKEVVEEAKVKEMLVRFEDGDAEGMKELVRGGIEMATVWRVVRAAAEDGVFGGDVVEAVRGLFR